MTPNDGVSIDATTPTHGAPTQNRQYDVAADGRVLINAELDSARAPRTLL
jgi:hypothetical protein